MARQAILTPDQQNTKLKASKAAPTNKEKIPERLFLFDVAPPPVSTAPPTSTPTAPSSQHHIPQAPSWPFPVLLPGTGTSTAPPPPITKPAKQGLGYEYGPEIYIGKADYWDGRESPEQSPTADRGSSRRDLTSKKAEGRKKKKGKKEKLCPTNGYQSPLARSTAKSKLVQVTYSKQRKTHTTLTKEVLPGGGVKRVWLTYVTLVEVEEERPIDEKGDVVEEGEGDGGEGGKGAARAGPGEVDIEIESGDGESSDNSDDEESSTDDESSSDDDAKKKRKQKGKGKSKTHKLACPKHPSHAAFLAAEKANNKTGPDTANNKATEPAKPENGSTSAGDKIDGH